MEEITPDLYSVTIRWNPRDQCYIATSDEIPLLVVMGRTRHLVLERWTKDVQYRIDSLRERNLELPKPNLWV